MKKAGIVLIVLQIIVIIVAFIGGKNPFAVGFFEFIGYFLCGIIGIILLIVSYKKTPKEANSDKAPQIKIEHSTAPSTINEQIKAEQKIDYNNVTQNTLPNCSYGNEFKDYLISLNYKEFTPSGHPSTVYQYIKSIENVLTWENLTWTGLAYNISSICSKYDVGGSKQHLGELSHNTVINALKRYKEFIQSLV